MPRRFAPNHLIRIKQRIGDTDEFETLLELYARRRDMTVTRTDAEGSDLHKFVTDYFVSPEIIVKLPPVFGAMDSETFGRHTFGSLPIGGRGNVERIKSVGGHIQFDHFIEDNQTGVTTAIVGTIRLEKGERMIRTIKVE